MGGIPPLRAADAPDLGLLQEQNRIKHESEDKIQRDVLDPILGKGKAMPFVDVEMELKITREQQNASGMGLAEKYKEKLGANSTAGAQTTFVLPGIPKPKTISQGNNGQPPEKPESVKAQQSQQIKGKEETHFSIIPEFKHLQVTVIHDDTVLNPVKDKEQVKLVTDRIVDAMGQFKLTAEQVAFRPTRFYQEKKKETPPWNWKEDIKHPEVYLPLLFATLLSLLLIFLFGPLAKFFRQYVAALKEKPAAEVNVESKIEQPDEDEGEGDNALEEEGKLDITVQRKPDEPPPPPTDEEDAMKKFEPFAYINEENIKRLVYMFMLRKEEPWVMAVVISYLRSDYARMVLASLPIEMQAKLALAALTVRQVTREQVVAIDNEVKESVDFVVGGLERLTSMLDEADPITRNNVLNYLKNEKPVIYERVRKFILSFEDIANFPDREMQTVVRELKTESMARALQNAPPEVINKFFANMSTGAASLLKESMEYSKGLTVSQIEEERGKIMDQIKVLEKEGKIAVREKPQEGIDMDLMAEDLGAQSRQQRLGAAQKKQESAPSGGGGPATAAPAAAGAQDTGQAQSYFAEGVKQHDAGQAEQSIQYFEYALSQDQTLWQAHQYLGNILYQMGRTAEAIAHYEKILEVNPDPQLRTWVESFKAQVGA